MPIDLVHAKWDSGALVFHDANNKGVGAEVLRIAQDDIGIGTSSNAVTMTLYGNVTLGAGYFFIGAPVKLLVTTKAVNSTLTVAEAGIILCSADNKTMILPTATGNTGLRYIFKTTCSISTGVTIDGSGAQTIDGQTTVVLYDQYEVLDIICDGTSWHII